MKKWEYMCQRISHDQHDLEKVLDKLGKDGWELVASPRITTNYSNATEVTVLIFKREIPEPLVAEEQTDNEIVIGTDFGPRPTPPPAKLLAGQLPSEGLTEHSWDKPVAPPVNSLGNPFAPLEEDGELSHLSDPPTGVYGECHCSCHNSPPGMVNHVINCCTPCQFCGSNITGDYEAHMLDIHPAQPTPPAEPPKSDNHYFETGE